VVRAFRSGSDDVLPVVPDTIAKSLAIGAPADGHYALKAIRATNGVAESASDPEIIAGIHLLARTEGIFTESAGGTVVAVAQRLAAQGLLRRDERTVLCITGNGLKTPEVVEHSSFPTIRLERASLGAFEDAIEASQELVGATA
jgi:threonine synthase